MSPGEKKAILGTAFKVGGGAGLSTEQEVVTVLATQIRKAKKKTTKKPTRNLKELRKAMMAQSEDKR